MKKYTLEPIRPEIDSHLPCLYRLCVDGEPTVIAIKNEELALLNPHGSNIERRALEILFKSSPARKDRLAKLPR